MSQLTYNEFPADAYAGMAVNTGLKMDVSGVAATRQLEQVVIDTASNSEKYSVTINGTNYDFTSDASATAEEIRDGLKAAIDAGSDTTITTDESGTDTLLVEAANYDADDLFTISLVDNAAKMTLTQLVAHEQSIGFGKVVVEDERNTTDPQTGKAEAVRLPRLSTDISARKTFGVALFDASIEPSRTQSTLSAQVGGYDPGTTIPIRKFGQVWVEVEDIASVVRGGQAYVRFSASGSEELGAIRTDADTADAGALPGAYFTGQVSGNFAVLDLMLQP